MAKVSVKDIQQQSAKKHLLTLIKPGDTVYCLTRHKSKSGMSRVIDLFVVKDNRIIRIGYSVAEFLDWKYSDEHGGIRVSGCGMDMGFNTVYCLSSKLFADAEGVEPRAQSWLRYQP